MDASMIVHLSFWEEKKKGVRYYPVLVSSSSNETLCRKYMSHPSGSVPCCTVAAHLQDVCFICVCFVVHLPARISIIQPSLVHNQCLELFDLEKGGVCVIFWLSKVRKSLTNFLKCQLQTDGEFCLYTSQLHQETLGILLNPPLTRMR